MSESSFRKFYAYTEFLAVASNQLTPNPEAFKTFLATYGFDVVPINVEAIGNDTIMVEWTTFPSQADIPRLDAAVEEFTGGSTDEPFEVESLDATSATTSNLVGVIDFTTPPLDSGTYQVTWNALVGMLATVANTGVRGVLTLTRTQGSDVVSRQWEHNWNLQQPQLFGSVTTFRCQSGATIRAHLQVAKLGAAAATAQMGGARVTIDKIG